MKVPPVDFLLVCSGVSLREFELNRLNLAANIRKNVRELLDGLVEAEAEALLARWLIEHREQMLSVARPRDLQTSFEFLSAVGPAEADHSPLALPAGPNKIASQEELSNHGSKIAHNRRNQKQGIAS
jgi:hypothetical protein